MTLEKYKPTLNQRFGSLVVISLQRKGVWSNISRVNKYLYKCKCDCGKICYSRAEELFKSKKKSCGCKMGTKYLGKNIRTINILFSRYRRDAKIRKFKWELSYDDFKLLINGNCFYCGIEYSNKRKVHHSLNGTDILLFNGIDRLNSKKGYIFTNCVSCCVTCNLMKNKALIDNFLAHIEKIYNYLNLKNSRNIVEMAGLT